ncbi:nucleotidyltransferase family protein [Brevundimonas aveniformis]|uniref:nucleotidyltransferase family protein n=1 Tax=Brevundimonas aveniformis TaxID=370977 RepID=UPI002490EC61|nr:nucleotidyltransferase family protein [Brevundimonas aveniformis]
MTPARADDLADILRASPDVMHVLTTVRTLGLPDWRLFSGAVYQTVWNHQTRRDPAYGLKDFDIGYFDPDTSWDAEDVFIKRVAEAFDEPFRSTVEVRNQARVHLWFQDRFGEPYAPLANTDEALSRFVCPAFAVGVRLEDDDTISVAAPFGLDDVFDMVLRPNPNRREAKGWARVTASAQGRWPECRILS